MSSGLDQGGGTPLGNLGIPVVNPQQGDVLYFNGTVWTRLGAGTSGYALQTQGTGANPVWAASTAEQVGAVRGVPLTYHQETSNSTVTRFGGRAINAGDYAVAGKTTVLTLTLDASVTGSGLTGTVVLVDITTPGSPSTLATITVPGTATTPTVYTATVSLSTGTRLLELRASVAGGASGTDQVVVEAAELVITHT